MNELSKCEDVVTNEIAFESHAFVTHGNTILNP